MMNDTEQWGEIERPRAIKVMAILHFVMATIGLIRIAGNLSALKELRMAEPVAGGGHPTVVVDAYHAYAQVCRMYHSADIVAALCLMALLIAAGITLLMDRSIGRTLSLVYAVSSVLMRVALLIFYTQTVHVLHVTYLQEIHKTMPSLESLMPIPSSSGWFVGLLLGLAYPIWVWWYSRKDEVKAYYSA